VDAAYKFDLREINEMNFARFDAKLEQRFAESNAKLEQRFAESDAKVERRLAEFRDDMRKTELSLERALREQTRFFFLAWAVLLASNIALWFR
jgi:t-SNARE complex subunit (syntaxin)